MRKPINPFTIVGLLIVLGFPIILIFVRRIIGHSSVALIAEGECAIWAIFGIVLCIAAYIEKEPILFTTNGMGALKTTGLVVFTMVSMFLLIVGYRLFYKFVLKAVPPHENMMAVMLKYPNWLKMLICIRAGVVEETFFRAYAMSRILSLTNNRFLAFIIPLVAFGAGHFAYGTLNHIIMAFLLGLVLALYYLKTKNLLSNIIAHTLYDILGMIR